MNWFFRGLLQHRTVDYGEAAAVILHGSGKLGGEPSVDDIEPGAVILSQAGIVGHNLTFREVVPLAVQILPEPVDGADDFACGYQESAAAIVHKPVGIRIEVSILHIEPMAVIQRQSGIMGLNLTVGQEVPLSVAFSQPVGIGTEDSIRYEEIAALIEDDICSFHENVILIIPPETGAVLNETVFDGGITDIHTQEEGGRIRLDGIFAIRQNHPEEMQAVFTDPEIHFRQIFIHAFPGHIPVAGGCLDINLVFAFLNGLDPAGVIQGDGNVIVVRPLFNDIDQLKAVDLQGFRSRESGRDSQHQTEGEGETDQRR